MKTACQQHPITLLIFTSLWLLGVQEFAGARNTSRDFIVAQQMDCVNQQRKGRELTQWNDVCAMSTLASHPTDGRDDVINTYLNYYSAVAKTESSNVTQANPSEDNWNEDSTTTLSSNVKSTEQKKWFQKLLSREDPLNTLEIAADAYEYSYQEPNVMKNKGKFFGMSGAYTYRLSEHQPIRSWNDMVTDNSFINMFRLDGRFAVAQIDYESDISGTMTGIDDYMIETRGMAGYDLPVMKDLIFTPYVGIGYRYLNDDSSGKDSSTGDHGYDRESRYYYLPMGLEFSAPLPQKWSIASSLEYDWFLSGRQTSHLEDAGPAIESESHEWFILDNVDNRQDKGFGVRGSCKIMRKTKAIDFILETYLRYWHIQDSDLVQLTSEQGAISWYIGGQPLCGLEPENKTVEYGLKLGLLY